MDFCKMEAWPKWAEPMAIEGEGNFCGLGWTWTWRSMDLDGLGLEIFPSHGLGWTWTFCPWTWMDLDF